MNNEYPIDFVITWVDGNDEAWRNEKSKYSPTSEDDDRKERYRDWDNLQYLFRGIEEYTPWVNKIHFVTYGHLPKWLNTNNSKLHIVRHEDFIKEDALPLFNVFPIEVNLHRIPEISDRFVYFNDDMFLLKPLNKEVFFKNGLPCDTAALSVHCYSEENWFHMSAFKNVGIMNKYFNMKEVLANNKHKWFNPKYGRKNLQTLILMNCPRFPGFWPDHMPQSFLKETFEELWGLESEALERITYQRFRTVLTMNQWLFKDWQLCKGTFCPRSYKTGKSFECSHGIEAAKEAAKYIVKKKGKMICINDGRLTDEEYDISKKIINDALNTVLPQKSSFEL